MGAVAGLLLMMTSGCSSSMTSVQPAVPDTTSSMVTSTTQTLLPTVGPRNAAQISPCDDLSGADVIALSLDPATKQKADLQGQVVSERGCGWKGKDVLVDVSSTNATVAMYKTRTDLADVQLPVVAGLPSISFHAPSDPGGCSLISDVPGGGLVVQLGIKGEHEAAVGVDSCTAAVRVMEQVAPILLKVK